MVFLPSHRWLALSAVLLGALTGCAHAPGPLETGAAYARALEEDRLADAYALTSVPAGQRPAFLQRYADAQARQSRAHEVRASLEALQARGPALALAQTPEGWRILEADPEEAPRVLLRRFLDAVDAGDWQLSWSLLSGPLRERYTPRRLHEDFQREPLAAERLERARLSLKGPLQETEAGVNFPLGGERAVRLVREGGEFRVAALE